MPGPLHGIRVVEMSGLGPTPFCAMMLADAGADVVTIARPAGKPSISIRAGSKDAVGRGRRHLTLDLKKPGAIDTALRVIDTADALLEGFRPGTMERLGLGPDVCLARNPRLVYGRATGWGQTGPLAKSAGHDINYVAITGALHAIGGTDEPVPPLNLVGDYGGGGMMMAFGMTAALLESRASGKGQVVDGAMCDGVALLMAPFYALVESGSWRDARRDNSIDGGAPDYGTYRCSDGRHVSIGPLEAAFYDQFLNLLGVADEAIFRQRHDRAQWPELRRRFTEIFAQKTRDEWTALLEGTDVCFAPVLKIAEAASHPHLHARGTLVPVEGSGVQPAPAPRFSRTVAPMPGDPQTGRESSRRVLAECGFDAAQIAALEACGAVAG